MKKLRLLVWEDCNRKCKGCCNKDWDLKSLPVCKDFTVYDEILITGGEPLLYPVKLSWILGYIKRRTDTPIYIYTASNNTVDILTVLLLVKGITLTLHTKKDVGSFKRLNTFLHILQSVPEFRGKSLRLNVFEGISLDGIDLSLWKVKEGMKWIKNCPLPEDEVLMRWEA